MFNNLYNEKDEKNQIHSLESNSDNLLFDRITKADHKKLVKRAEEGHASYKDLYMLMKGDMQKQENISYSELRVILRRLGLNPTKHRIAEFISAAK